MQCINVLNVVCCDKNLSDVYDIILVFLWIDADERDGYATCADRICYNIPTKESCLKHHSYRENRS